MSFLNIGPLSVKTITLPVLTLILGVAVYGVYLIICLWFRYRLLKKIFDDVPGPDDIHWIYGNLHLLPERGIDRLKVGQQFNDKYKRYYRFWVGPFRAFLVLIHPETIKVVLKSSEPKPKGFGDSYRHMLPWLGEGLLLSDGERWSRSRRLLTPAFHFDVLCPYIKIYNQAADILLDKIESYMSKEESFDVYQPMSLCTLDIILQCAFSYETDCQFTGESHPYVKAVIELAGLFVKRSRKPLLFPDFIYYLTAKGRHFLKQCKYVHDVAEEVIEKRKQFLDKNGPSKGRCLDFLDILLTAKDDNGIGLTKLEIRNEVDTFMFEGHDTTASSISWVLYSMAEHPEYQEKCQAEIEEVLAGRDTDYIELDDLPKLKYLSMCIKEGMRFHSPVPLILRVATREVTIDGKTFPAGTPLTVSLYSLHHNPEVWEDHMKFKPERFTEENISKMDSFAFCPFSAGPRNCIGQNFAKNEEKVLIARILNRYRLEVDPAHEPMKKIAAVMRAENGIRLFAHRRK